jgi:tetratricopeptide (TPR) repeat protein
MSSLRGPRGLSNLRGLHAGPRGLRTALCNPCRLRAGPVLAFVLALGVVHGACPVSARADEPLSAARLQYAREQARQGVAHVRAQRWAEGRQALREAAEVREMAVLLYYLGICELGLGNLREAQRRLNRAIEIARAPGTTSETADIRRQVIEDAGPPLRDVEARLPLEGADAKPPLRIDPGDHSLVAKAPGWKASTLSFHLEEGQARELDVSLDPEASRADVAPASTVASPPPPAAPGGDWQGPAGVVGIGLGVTLLGVGALSTARVDALEKRYEGDPAFRAYHASAPGRDLCALADDGHEAPPGTGAASARGVRSTCDAAGRFSALQYVFYGAGVAFVAAGAYFAFFAPTPGKVAPDRASWQLVPTLGLNQGGLGARLTF